MSSRVKFIKKVIVLSIFFLTIPVRKLNFARIAGCSFWKVEPYCKTLFGKSFWELSKDVYERNESENVNE